MNEENKNNLVELFSKRFPYALNTWDPLAKIPFVKWLDPFDPKEKISEKSGKIKLSRFFLFLIIGSAPPLIFSLMASRTLGGGFWEDHGMKKDVLHFFYQWILFPSMLMLILFGRRILGDMINQIRAVFNIDMKLENRLKHAPRLLKFLEWASRLTGARFFLWAILLVVLNIFAYLSFLKDGFFNWLTSPATPQSFFFFAKTGVEQPNLAGIWACLISGPLLALSIFIIARLVVEFSLTCSYMAHELDGRIMPAHPDNTGGLLVVGRTALVISLPIMVIGLSQTVITLQEAYIWGKSISWTVFLNWALYIGLCPLFFLLPLMPLRRVMYKAKRSSLFQLQELYRVAFSEDEKKLLHAEGEAASEQLQGHVSALDLIDRVSGMSVWPFDKKSFIRFIGVVVTPVMPLVASEAPRIIQGIIKYLTH